jgi:D-sedoheptulose 7-phosphate isomerase
MIELIRKRVQDSVSLKSAVLGSDAILGAVEKAVHHIVNSFRNQGKVFWCGNGGSAADAQHLSAELSGRFYYDRPPLFSEALHVNTSYITAVANDYSYDIIYARLVEAMCSPGDVLMALSTSGNSANVIRALEKAREKKVITVGFTEMASLCDVHIAIPSADTPRIQECHMLLGHTICELVESQLFPRNK